MNFLRNPPSPTNPPLRFSWASWGETRPSSSWASWGETLSSSSWASCEEKLSLPSAASASWIETLSSSSQLEREETGKGCRPEVDEAILKRHYEQMGKSEGFDIVDFPGGWHGIVRPMSFDLQFPEKVVKLKKYAPKALAEYNHLFGACYEVVDILDVNEGGDKYITPSISIYVSSFDLARTLRNKR